MGKAHQIPPPPKKKNSSTLKRSKSTPKKQLDLKAKQMNWLLGRSTLSIGSKLLLYKALLKPIWTYAIQVWGAASNSNIDILQNFQSKPPPFHSECTLVHRQPLIHEDLQMNTVLNEIKKWNTKHLRKFEYHTNALAVNLLDNSETTQTEKIHHPNSDQTDLSETPIQELK
jgi:hypothetical protein